MGLISSLSLASLTRSEAYRDAIKAHYDPFTDCLTKKTKAKFESDAFKASAAVFQEVADSNGKKSLARTKPGSGFWEEFNFHVEDKPSDTAGILTDPPPTKRKKCTIS